VPDEALTAYMEHCARRIGDAYFRTPRETVRGFLGLLALVDQHPHLRWSELLDAIEVAPAHDPDLAADDELTSFRL
jgi:hypothetical protein